MGDVLEAGDKVLVSRAMCHTEMQGWTGFVTAAYDKPKAVDTILGRTVHVEFRNPDGRIQCAVFCPDHGDVLTKQELTSQERQLLNRKALTTEEREELKGLRE